VSTTPQALVTGPTRTSGWSPRTAAAPPWGRRAQRTEQRGPHRVPGGTPKPARHRHRPTGTSGSPTRALARSPHHDDRHDHEVPVPTAASGVHGIIAGPDGNLWFTENLANKFAKITTAGVVTELACIPTAARGPTNITVGPDGRLWLTETSAGKIARVQIP
jgi:hypothetical protein